MNNYQKANIILALFAGVCIWQMLIDFDLGIGLFIIGLLLYGALMFWFSMNMWANFFVQAMSKMPDDRVMLTFDDGPHPDYTLKILDILKEREVKALFFLIGKEAEKYPDIVRRIQSDGHLIGGHSYHHGLTFGLKGKHGVHEDIMRGQNLISALIGEEVILFRPPFGVTNPQVALCIKNENLSVVGWNVRSFDTTTKDSVKIAERVGNRVKPGSIILLHDRLPQTIQALPSILDSIIKKKLALDVLLLNKKRD